MANTVKIIAHKGKVLYCEELKRYATATTDTKHDWEEVNLVEENEEEETQNA